MSTIGETLKKLKEAHGYSTNQVAKAIRMTGSTYSKVERDQREASFIMIYRICRFYEISMYEFADMLSPAELERSDFSTIRVLEKRKKKEL
jgi:transcriptional regulator with XRE-family HTH domain